jgi:multiple sugar transport system ATP-binding protein
MNLVEAVIEDGTVRFGEHVVPVDPQRRPARDGRVVLGIRPEAFEDGKLAAPHLPRIRTQVDVLEELGADTHACFHVRASKPAIDTGDESDEASLLASETMLFTARLDPRTDARQGDATELAVDPARFHFFDIADGSALVGDEATPADEPDVESVPATGASWS